MRNGRMYRTLRLYNWLIGISGGLTVLGVGFVGSRLPTTLRSPEVMRRSFNLLEHYIQVLLIANLVMVGAVIIRGPWATEVVHLLRQLAQRCTRRGADAVEPRYAQGALLTLRVALIAPSIMLMVLLPAEHKVTHVVERAVGISLTLATIAGLGALAGVLAVYIRRSIRKHAVAVWFALWLAPELVRAVAPVTPTPRTIIDQVLTTTSFGEGDH